MRLGNDDIYFDACAKGVFTHVSDEDGTSEMLIPYSDIEFVTMNDFDEMSLLVLNFPGGKDPFILSSTFLSGNNLQRKRYDMQTFKYFVEAMIKRDSNNKNSVSTTNETIESLLKLKSLLDSGLITEAEFNAMKSGLMANANSVKPEPLSMDGGNIGKCDFDIDDGTQTWNFIDTYEKAKRAWYEFCFSDTDYISARGLAISSSYNDILNAFDDVEPYIDNDYDYTQDDLYIWSHLDNKFRETRTLIFCDKVVRYMLKGDDGYNYILSFYFSDNKLKVVGYIKKPQNS